MANQTNLAPGTVFDGRVGTGAAQVLGGPGDPVGAYANQKHIEQARKIAAEKERALARQKRDEKFKLKIDQDPDAVKAPFVKQLNNAFDQLVRKPTLQAYHSNVDPDNLDFQSDIDKNFERVNELAATGNAIMEAQAATLVSAKEDPYTDYDYIVSKTNDLIYEDNENIDAKPYDQIPIQAIQEAGNDPASFLIGSYANDFVKNLKETVIDYKVKGDKALGLDTTDIIKLKKKLYVVDPDDPNEILMKDGRPVINVTPEVVQGFESNPKARRWLNYEMEKTGDTKENIIAKYVAPHAYIDKNISSKTTKYPSGDNNQSVSDYEIVQSNDMKLKDYQDVGDDGLVGSSGVIVPTPNIAKNIQFTDDVLSDVQGLRVNEEGDPVIMTTSTLATDMKSEVTSGEVPLTPSNLAKIRNSFKTQRQKNQFDNLVSKFKSRLNEVSRIEVDTDRLNGVVTQLENEWANLKKGSNNEVSVSKNIQKILKQYNIDAEVEADNGVFYDDIKINGTSYSLDKKDDLEKIKGMIFNASKSAFTKIRDPQQEEKGKKEDYTPEVLSAIEAFSESNGISREEAIKVLKANGRL